MITKPLDSNGKPLKTTKGANGKIIPSEEEIDHRKAYSGAITHEMFSVLSDEDGNKIYHKVGVQGHVEEAALTEAIGITDDITNKVKAKTKYVNRQTQIAIDSQWDAKILKNEVAIASSTGGIFATPEFKADAQEATIAGGFNRTKAIKAYYLAASYIKNQGELNPDLMLSDKIYTRGNKSNFTNSVNYSPELKKALINQKVTDVQFIKMMGKITAAENPEDLEYNEQVTATWIKFYELLNKK